MKPQVISNALHLRKPQAESLEILANIANAIPLAKGNDIKTSLQAIRDMYPDFGEFERTFPSFCFALATGVGKTRLMGAFIAYLFLEKGIRHFFILAPNLTIHQKLVADFTPNTPKYVFEGLTEFTINAPLILTGDNFDKMSSLIANENTVQINIFNISKINSEERTIKKMSEYLGESYFNYLSGLDDLVLLMDEAHRYRAKAGMKAIEELNPILGLELTATPQAESGNKSVAFKNIIYNYPLFHAMDDGYVKEPAVATRENFDVSKYTDPEKLDQLKLLDGIYIHENAKTELYTYAKNNNKPLVKPFMLVVCKDTSHAEEVVAYIGSDDFFGGVYKDKVITVHSSQKGEEKDETVERLMAVENPDEPTEIVVHVNMLKEGWDVTNLYTIVPLRAANSRTLVEQSIGRGLRLPYGKRTGVSAVDRLTVVAHDRFDEIIREANSGQSIMKYGVVVGRDIPDKRPRVVPNPPLIETLDMPEEEKPIAKITQEVIKEFESLPSSEKLNNQEIKQEIVKRVNEAVNTGKFTQMYELLGNENTDIEHIAKVVERTIDTFTKHTIDIPRVMLVPKSGSANFHYIDFELDTSKIHKYPCAVKYTVGAFAHTRQSLDQRCIYERLSRCPSKLSYGRIAQF